MNILIANLDKDGTRVGDQIAGDGKAISEIG